VNRRTLLRHAAQLAAVAALGTLPHRTWAALPRPEGWTEAEAALLDGIGDTILPATPGSPGAGSVAIGRFILRMTADCYPPAAATALRQVLARVRAAAGSRNWANLSANVEGVAPWRHLKDLVLLGYFTSEAGATQALRYDPVPGAYRGSVPLKTGDRAWAT
jgi:hypothetical protein